MVAVLKAPPPNFNPRTTREWVEDIAIKIGNHCAYVSVQVDHRTDEDNNIIVGTIYYDAKPITALPGLVEVIEKYLEDERA